MEVQGQPRYSSHLWRSARAQGRTNTPLTEVHSLRKAHQHVPAAREASSMSQPARLACWTGAGREGRTPAAKRCPLHRWPALRTRGGRPGRLNAGASLTRLNMWKIARPKESPCRFLSLGARAFSTGRAVFDYREATGEIAIVAANTGNVEPAYGGRREASPRCQIESLCCWALLLHNFCSKTIFVMGIFWSVLEINKIAWNSI